MKLIYLIKTSFIILIFLSAYNAYSQDPNFHIYLCFGQSNMAGAGTIETQDKTVDSRFQVMEPMDCQNLGRSAGKWYPAMPPLWGCNGGLGPADYFGRTMVQNLSSTIKIGVLVVAIPGCDIALFGKTGYQGFDTYNYVPSKYSGSAYAWLLDLAKLAQRDGVIKGILLHQGETNNGQTTWPTKVKGVYDNIIKDLGLVASQTPLLAGELLYQNQGGVCWGHNSVIATLPNVIQNSYVISASGLPGKDQFHFNSEGNRTFGMRYAEKMLSLLPTSKPPVVTITSPADKSSFSTLQTVIISANASDEDGSIRYVSFYDSTILLGSDSTAPYSITCTGLSAGIRKITASAVDDKGTVGTSEATTITITAEQGPFKATVHQIPGRIEAEEFDLGGEGVAYHEANTNGNEGKALFRAEQVDIEKTNDTSGVYNVGYTLRGEWLEYTVYVKSTGMYSLDLRVAANGDGKSLHVVFDSVNVSRQINVPNTGGYQTWATVNISNVNLTQGQHTMCIVFDSDYMNLNYVEFKGLTDIKIKDVNNNKLCQVIFSSDKLCIIQKGPFSYRIINISGMLIEKGNGLNIQSMRNKLTPGIYTISVCNVNGNIFTRKILRR